MFRSLISNGFDHRNVSRSDDYKVNGADDNQNGAKSGEYGGWGKTYYPNFSSFRRMTFTVCGRALS